MHSPPKSDTLCSNCSKMINNEAVEQAISDLRSQKPPKYAATAKKYNIDRTTLMCRFKGETTSYSKARSRSNKLLTNAQESVLIEYIRKLSNQGLHSTPRILKNLAVELVHKPIGERWIERFRKRYENRLTSVYLRNIDQSRHIADKSRHFEHYFATIQAHLHYFASSLYLCSPANSSLFSFKKRLRNIILSLQTHTTLMKKAFYWAYAVR